MRRVSRILIAALLLSAVATAERYRFRNYGPDEGLNTAVSVILQDRTGFLWVGTGNGLFRYDGARFQRFGLEDGLPSRSIRCLHESSDGTLWVATGAGLARLRRDRFETVDLGMQAQNLDLHALESANGKIYVGLDQGLVSAVLRSDAAPDFHLEPGVPQMPVWGLHADAGGALWFSSGMRLAVLDRGRLHMFDDSSGLPPQRWGAMLRDQQGNLWIRGPQRMFVLPRGAQRFGARDEGLSQSSNTILALAQDRRGMVMAATDHGLARWKGGKWRMTGTAQGLESDSVTAVYEDREGSLWIGMWGAGLARWPGSGEWTNWSMADGLTSNVVWAIRRDSSGSVWVGTDRGLLRMESGAVRGTWTHEDGLGGDKVKAVVVAPDGAVWTACLPGGVSRLDPATGKIRTYGLRDGLGDDRVVAIHLDLENRLWASTGEGLYRSTRIGPGMRFERQVLPGLPERTTYFRFLAGRGGGVWVGSTQGLYRWDAGKWTHFTTAIGLRSNAITHLAETRDGALWVAYREALGISRLIFREHGTQIQHVGVKDGLPSDYALFLGLDSGGRLWVGTDNGVAAQQKAGWEVYTHEDGLVWDDCAANAFQAEPGGAVWIGTLKGLSRFQPATRPAPRLPPPAVILGARFGEHPVQPQATPVVPFHDRDFSVSFSGLSFLTEKGMRFRYRLIGLDDRWVETSLRETHYAGLPAGAYRFEVAARNPGGAWSALPAALEFRIVPPWWATWWFRAVSAVAVVALLSILVRARMKQLLREHRRLESAVRERTRELELQNDLVERQKHEIEDLLRQSEEVSRLKSEFLANMSHEIRTPMNGVIGMTQLVLSTCLDEEQKEYITTVRDSAEALLVVINDILDFSKIEAGKMALACDLFNVRKCVADALQVFVWNARERGIQLSREIAPDVPEMVLGDADRLRQILLNLVANAMKFTDRGQIDVTVALGQPTEPPNLTLQFSVRDTGFGIPYEKQGSIFEAFEQADGSTTRRKGGTGLGLAICAKLVRLMGGQIGVVSESGRGSTFTFSVLMEIAPVLEDVRTAKAPGVTPQGGEFVVPAAAKPLRILLAEDNAVNRLVARRLIEKMGHSLYVVEDGPQAVQAALEGRFDIILMDVQMPEMDGFEATARIRQAERERPRPAGQPPQHVPIIAMTAHAMSGDREHCLSAGMDDYISKPITIRAVVDAIARVRRSVPAVCARGG
jgi:signal transduction histidine kinase/ligand-binding sensor domain-containing protein/AmiR/NasT family two-component response regulator